MNQRRYDVLALILALAALATSTLLFSLPPAKISDEAFRIFYFCGWIPGLALSITSFLVKRRLTKRILKFIIWTISSVAILSAIWWAEQALLFMILSLIYRS